MCSNFLCDHYLVWWVRVRISVRVDVSVMIRVSNFLGSG